MRVPRVREVLEFKSRVGQISYSIANGSPPPHIYALSVLPWRYDAEMGTANSLHTSA